MSVLNENTLMGASAAGGYEIDNSLRFNDVDSAYLSRTPSVAGNRKTWTWSGWVKLGDVSTSNKAIMSAGSSGTVNTYFAFNNNRFFLQHSTATVFNTSGLFRDPSAWYHVTLVVDTSNATAADRVRMYMNGELQVNIASPIALNTDTHINDAIANGLGRFSPTAAAYFDGYLAEVNFIDGQALTPDSFGETGDYGEWIPKAYAGARGTNGFYLDFKDSGSLGNDAAGSNNWTPTNLAATDQMLDSPTNNFATLNPLGRNGIITPLSEGNLRQQTGSSTGYLQLRPATLAPSSGLWYFEYVQYGTYNYGAMGLIDYSNAEFFSMMNSSTVGGIGGYATGLSRLQNGNTTINGGTTVSTPAITQGSIAQMAFDVDTGKVWVGTDGVWYNSGNPATGVNPTVTATGHTSLGVVSGVSDAGDQRYYLNFGQDSSFAGNKTAQGNTDSNGIGDFYYAPPSGFLALCTKNLPDATVVPSEHFNTVLYTGDGSTHTITSVGFQPDLVWGKSRSAATSNSIYDSVRGVALELYSDNTEAEANRSGSSGVSVFDSDGFTVIGSGNLNTSGNTYAAWNWKAGGTGVSNTDGTLTSTVSTNVNAGFSIVSWVSNGTSGLETMGHGLTKAPELVLTKNRNAVSNWVTYNESLGNNQYLSLNTTSASLTYTPYWSTSSTTWGQRQSGLASSGDSCIAYAFHSVDGYSKVGSYTGNGSSDGPMVYTGFRPAYVMQKRTDVANDWDIYDASRDTYNVGGKELYANSSSAEGSAVRIDFTSNGFKLRASNNALNASGATYIYLAFAKSPFKHSNAR